MKNIVKNCKKKVLLEGWKLSDFLRDEKQMVLQKERKLLSKIGSGEDSLLRKLQTQRQEVGGVLEQVQCDELVNGLAAGPLGHVH